MKIEFRRVISTEEGQDFAEKHNLLFLETSAKNAVNIEQVCYISIMKVFNQSAEHVYKKIEKREIDVTNEVMMIYILGIWRSDRKSNDRRDDPEIKG
jgi:hypothetical protein